MPTLSRRSVLGGTIALPASSVVGLRPTSQGSLGSASCPLSDPIVSNSAAWTAADGNLTAMQQAWQDYESAVFAKARRMKICCARACDSNWPEAQAMRDLDQQITAAYAHLAALAGKIQRMRATTVSGAIAKIQLGLQVQGPYDWQDNALELVEGGLVELRELTGLA